MSSRDGLAAETYDPRLDLLTPGSILIERYVPEKGKPQWCVHKVLPDGTLTQLYTADARWRATQWAVSNV